MKAALELAHIVKQYREKFQRQHSPFKEHLRVLNAIVKCRTAALGGHVDQCGQCGHVRISYNSCRNRHCPKCQGTNRERWILDRHADLLPVPYFHVVFTLPAPLNGLCLRHPAALYEMLFHASKETIIALGHDEKHLGAAMGLISVLHTWGQNLSLHPHVHCIVPGGGLTQAGHWRAARNRARFLFPVKVMSAVFRGKFMEKLKMFCQQEKIVLDGDWISALYKTHWVVYARQPFRGPAQVIEYLGRYTHRIAISNHRLKSMDNGQVTFSYKDYRLGGTQRLLTLDACEFLRRFCLHILPHGFRKIRHYGLLSSRKKSKLKMQQMKMGLPIGKKEKISWKQIAKQSMGFDADACPCCKTGKMITLLFFQANAPPLLTNALTGKKTVLI